MPYAYLFLLLLIASTVHAQLQPQTVHPDYSVKFLSYYGIGSASVQKPSVLGYKATWYAQLQQALPDHVPQGIGVPVYFYQQLLKDAGVQPLIETLKKDYKSLNEEDLEKQLTLIRKKIEATAVSQSLLNQLKNAIEEFYPNQALLINVSPNYWQGNTNAPYCGQYYTFAYDGIISSQQLAQCYASVWTPKRFKAAYANGIFGNHDLAVGLLITGRQTSKYAESFVYTTWQHAPKTPSITIKSQYWESQEIIQFTEFDSKWYHTIQKGEKQNCFVDEPELTPTARAIQSFITTADPILRGDHVQEGYSCRFFFMIDLLKENGKDVYQLNLLDWDLSNKVDLDLGHPILGKQKLFGENK